MTDDGLSTQVAITNLGEMYGISGSQLHPELATAVAGIQALKLTDGGWVIEWINGRVD